MGSCESSVSLDVQQRGSRTDVRVSNARGSGGSGPAVRCLLGWFAALYNYVAARQAEIGRGCVKTRASLCWWETIGNNDCVSSGHPKFSPTQAHKMAKRR